MRIFKGLENVHAIIDQHEAEWRRENGEEPLEPRPRIRPRAQNLERKVVERYSEALTPAAAENERARFDPERFAKSAEPQVKAINVIEQGDGEHHSWLYKEVMKAINDAAEGNKDVKIIAVFIPVIQNSKEFDNFPADETVTVSSAVNEEDVHAVKPEIPEPEINNSNIVEDLIPPTHVEADSELTEAFQTIQENLDLNSDSESGLMMEAPEEPEILPDEPVVGVEEYEESQESASPVEAVAPVEDVEDVKPEELNEPVELDEPEEPEEKPETLAFDVIDTESESESETQETVAIPEDEDLNSETDSESESELPDIPELDSNPDELTIELEEPSEPAEPVEPVEAVKIQEVNEPEEPDAGFPFPEEPDDDSIIDEGGTLDSGERKESSNLEPEAVREAGEESITQDKDEADELNELKELKSVDIEII